MAATALALLAALGAASASAGTAYVDGVSDQNLGLWQGDYLDASGAFTLPFTSFFQGLVGRSERIAASAVRAFRHRADAVEQGGACEENLDNWFTYVTQTLHLIPVIAVWDVAEGGCANDGAPSNATYTTDVEALLAHLDGLYAGTSVPYIEAWNEPNSSGVAAATRRGVLDRGQRRVRDRRLHGDRRRPCRQRSRPGIAVLRPGLRREPHLQQPRDI